MKRLLPALLLVAACGNGGVADTTTTTVPAEDFVSRQTLLTDNMVAQLEDGVYLGYLTWVATVGMGGGGEIHLDLAVWFSGDEADTAAAQDGEEAPANPFYIRNLDPSQLVLNVSNTVAVTSVWYHEAPEPERAPITWQQLVDVWRDTPADGRANLRNSPWWITITDGVVVSIDEQYVP